MVSVTSRSNDLLLGGLSEALVESVESLRACAGKVRCLERSSFSEMRKANRGSSHCVVSVASPAFSHTAGIATLVALMPSLSQAALSHMWAKARNAPASQLVLFFLPPLFEYNPTRRTSGSHSIAHDADVTSSECWTGLLTLATAPRTANSSGASSR